MNKDNLELYGFVLVNDSTGESEVVNWSIEELADFLIARERFAWQGFEPTNIYPLYRSKEEVTDDTTIQTILDSFEPCDCEYCREDDDYEKYDYKEEDDWLLDEEKEEYN